MRKNKILDQAYLMAILGAIFILVVAILDATIGVPFLANLLIHSAAFQIGLIMVLWIVAYAIVWFLKKNGGE